MPGLFGTAGDPLRAPSDGVTGFEALGRGVQGGWDAASDPDGAWSVGRVHLGVLQPDPQVGDGHSPVVALVHGEVHNEANLRRWLVQAGEVEPPPGAAAVVSALYQRVGPEVATQLSGPFCAVIVDAPAKRLLVVNDLVGTYPIYWAHRPGRLAFGPRVRAVAAAAGLEQRLDPRALADSLGFGFLLGEKTLVEGVHLLGPGITLTYDWGADTLRLAAHARLTELFRPWEGPAEEGLERLAVAFKTATDRAYRGAQRLVLSLSGGLDSRAILAARGAAKGDETYTLGVRGCADEVIGAELATLTGSRHAFVELGSAYLADFLPGFRQMVAATDGMYLTHGLTESLALRYLAERAGAVLIRGHGGELAKARLAWPFHTDARVLGMRSGAELASYLVDRLNYVTPGLAPDDILEDEWARGTNGAARQSLEESVAGAELGAADLCSLLYLQEHHRRYTVPSLELFRSVVEIRMPFIDPDFLACLFSLPQRYRDGTDLHVAFIRRFAPRLLKVRSSNTGAPADAGTLRTAIMEKVSRVLQILGVHGYRHYHNLKAWMAGPFLDTLEAELLAPSARTGGIFKRAAVRRLLGDARGGDTRHWSLLQAMLLLETWLQQPPGC